MKNTFLTETIKGLITRLLVKDRKLRINLQEVFSKYITLSQLHINDKTNYEIMLRKKQHTSGNYNNTVTKSLAMSIFKAEDSVENYDDSNRNGYNRNIGGILSDGDISTRKSNDS